VVASLLLVGPPLAAQSPGTAALDAAVQSGIAKRTYPAAVVMVGRADTILHARGYGSYAWNGDTRRPDPAWSLWDVASISKVVATASAVAVLVDGNLLDLDSPVSRFIPGFRGAAKDSITVRMLLDHTSGLPAWAALGSRDTSIAAALDRLLAIELRRPPGQAPIYSDLNAILAAMVVERVSGTRFEDFTRRVVFGPTGMTSASWRPTPADKLRAVPTDMHYDGLPYFGEVQDPNARALGGVAGHSGVFATGLDLARFAQRWLRGVRNQDSTWIRPTTMAQFLERGRYSETRALGWDTPLLAPPDGKPPLYGACATVTTFGHTGFTGTLLWIDPAADLFLVFLTNRSFQATKRSMSDIREARAAVSDAARRLAGERC
jgi:CubicO group peptidase (beta-lactamase class C family)